MRTFNFDSLKPKTASGLASLVLTLTGGYGATALATIPLADTPLYLTPPAKPNLIMAVDDSGSMDGELLLPTNDGAAWWRTASAADSCTAATGNSFIGCTSNGSGNISATGVLNFNHAGNAGSTWKKFVYLFPNGCGSGNVSDTFRRRYCNGDDHFAVAPVPANAWARSHVHNPGYFNPATLYAPWASQGSYVFGNMSATAARFDPVFGSSSDALNLTNDVVSDGQTSPTTSCNSSSITQGYQGDWGFKLFAGMVLPAGTCIRTSGSAWVELSTSRTVGDTVTPIPSGEPTLSDGDAVNIRYFPATFYLPVGATLPAVYGYIGATTTGYAPDGSLLTGYEIKPGNFLTPEQYSAASGNFANWFTYYRRRHQALRGGMGRAFSTVGGMFVSGFRINDFNADVTMRDLDIAANRDQVYTDMYTGWVRANGTPNRRAVNNIVRNFKRTNTGAPIQYSCQKNFGMLFTDGFSNIPSSPASSDFSYTIGNQDGSEGPPYADTLSDTLADLAMYAFKGPLRGPSASFPLGRVPTPLACRVSPVDPRLDCNNDLHMSFFAVTLGTRGIAFNPDATVDPYTTSVNWPPTIDIARHPYAVDDIWHATVNGRGQLLNARSPDEIATKLGAVLQTIADRANSSASSAAVNSGSISSNTRVYQARFDSTNWDGQLLSYRIDPATGQLITPAEWDAGAVLPAHGTRRIFTLASDGSPVAFTTTALASDTTRLTQLDSDSAVALSKIQYLRGDASNEGTASTSFRRRPVSKLGDIINSSPVFVGAPSFNFPNGLEPSPAEPYSTFVANNSSRTPMVYVGANDGMLHAFNGVTGVEEFAFIPSASFANLGTLPNRNYSHRYFVDGTPQVGDVLINGVWQTMLVGGLNKGGQAIYALNITNPTGFTSAQSNPSSLFAWEFTDADDSDLGRTYSQPQLVRLHNGKWAAVFGNGYNNTEADGNASTTGHAVLYIVDVEDGSLIRKISTQVGSTATPNGLATPAMVDIDGDRIVDFAFAGDLRGNMWKFDLRDPSASNWDIPYSVSGSPRPIFTATDSSGNTQPITQRPVVIRGPNGTGMAVLFGTGKYLESADNSLSPTLVQSFYGVYDPNSGTSTDVVSARSQLQPQTILDEEVVDLDGAGSAAAVNIRVTSANSIGATQRGWYMDLLSPTGYQAEKSVSNAIVRDGRLIFTTLIPSVDPCSDGGTSWLMELDALTGARLSISPFDLNEDGQFTNNDYATVTLPDGTTLTVPVSGLQSSEGILPTPGVVSDHENNREFKYTPGTSGNIQITKENPGAGATGRQSWRQVR